MAAPATSVDADGRFRRWTAVACLVAAVARLRSLAEPLTPDEGGALAIARAWSGGSRLYVDVWIDRPQGFLWLYRFGDLFTGAGLGFVRVLAITAGIVTVVGVADLARRLGGSWEVGAVAALTAAVLSSSPAIEGFTANGELLAAAFVVPGVAVAAAVVTGRLGVRWMFLSGALAGLALSVKQSGYDGFLAIGLWLVIAWLLRWRPRRDVVAMLVALVAGLVVVVAAMLAQGTAFGWEHYWYAIAGFRFGARSAVSSPQWGRLAVTGAIFLGLNVCLVGVAVASNRRQHRGLRWTVEPLPALALCWFATAGAALLTGGNYHRHYWLTVTFPLSVVFAMAVVGGRRVAGDARPWAPPLAPRLLVTALAAPVAVTAVLVAVPSLEQEHRVRDQEELVDWVQSNRRSADDFLQPICASAGWSVAADEAPRYPYFWVDHVRSVRGAAEAMVALLDDDERAPTFVAEVQDPRTCDRDGAIERAIERHYHHVATLDATEVLRRDDR